MKYVKSAERSPLHPLLPILHDDFFNYLKDKQLYRESKDI